MTTETILFIVPALVAVVSGLGMLVSQRTVYAALYLVVNFISVAVFYILLNAPFIAMAQVSVYAGAIMVLFLFVIMLLGTESLPAGKDLPWQRPVAVVLAVLLAGEAAYLLFTRGGGSSPVPAFSDSVGTPLQVGELLFNAYTLPFEVTSILLLVAMVGAIILTRKEKEGR